MKLSGAEIIVKILENQGITTIAGIPGGSVLPLYDELYKSSIKHVLVRHEQAAGFIAQGMSRTSGLPSVCIATSGPGALNLLTAIADARADSIPLVAITGQVTRSLIGTDAFQEADTFGLSFPITKHSVMVTSAAELLDVLPQAFALAGSGRPGPVLIDVPRDVQTEIIEINFLPEVTSATRKPAHYQAKGKHFTLLIEQAVKLIRESTKPVLYLGGGTNSIETSSLISDFLRIQPMPVVNTLMALGVVPATSPFNLGMIGMHGSVCANEAMYGADLVMAAGAHFDDRATGVVEKFCPNAKIIHIDIDAAELNKIYAANVSLVADVESVFPVLTNLLGEKGEKNTNKTAKSEWLADVQKLKQKEAKPTNAGNFIASIADFAHQAGFGGEKTIITTDVGQHQMWVAQHYPFMCPRQLLTSGSLGTMGFGLPAALGAALQNPSKRILCFTGDGSLMMNVQELATLAEENLDVTVIVLDNGALGMVRQQQEFMCDKRYSASIYKKSPDLCAIAAGFGIPVVDTRTSGWQKKAFPKTGGGPRFVYCNIDQGENVFPFVPGGKANIEAILE
ncbi:MAG TPA: biosynthetic-type acetolactate synthase large subunit [Treponemataceae bacterium]|nr:biosynthetic-type acetolactate synthase large subunit [Treponemataceae bacterium]